MQYKVYANGCYWGEFSGDTPEAAMQAAADECGTDGDTSGMVALFVSYYPSDDATLSTKSADK